MFSVFFIPQTGLLDSAERQEALKRLQCLQYYIISVKRKSNKQLFCLYFTDGPSGGGGEAGGVEALAAGGDVGGGELRRAHPPPVGRAGGAHSGARDRERPAEAGYRALPTGAEWYVFDSSVIKLQQKKLFVSTNISKKSRLGRKI